MSARTTNEPASAKDMRPAWRAQRGSASAEWCILDDGGVHPLGDLVPTPQLTKAIAK